MKGSPKYAVAERLGNYLNPELELPGEFKSLSNELLKCEYLKFKRRMKKYLKLYNLRKNDYEVFCVTKLIPDKGCQVSFR